MARRSKVPDTTWPTADEAGRSPLFQPAALGPITTQRRTWVPAMVPWRSNNDGFVTPDVLDWYGRFADGKPGVLVVEATGIRDVPSGPLLRIGHDRFIPGLQTLVETVHRRSEGATRLFIQVIDFLRMWRRPAADRYFRDFLAVRPEHRQRLVELGLLADPGAPEADVRAAFLAAEPAVAAGCLDEREREALEFGARERVTDLHLPHIADLPNVLPGLFADAASRARAAGFDGVELHYAHAYTMASFLSRRNDRTDGYGGSLDGRVRLPLEVFECVRQAVGDDFPVGCRFLGDEVIEGGSRLEDAVEVAERFARAGFDFLSVSKGGKFEDARQPRVGEAAYPYTGESGHECMPTVRASPPGPFGRNLPLARAVRARVREIGFQTPVVAAGGLNSFEIAHGALARGDCDFVGAARQSLADPDWFEKVRTGRGAEVRRCLFTNYCEALDQRHVEVTCQLWDRDFTADDPGRDGVRRSADGKRRLVAPPWSRIVPGATAE